MGTKKASTADVNSDPDGIGAEWRRPPPGWAATPPGPPAQSFEGVAQEFFDESVREQIAPQESFWRASATEAAKPLLAVERTKSATALLDTMLGMVKFNGWPTFDECIPPGSILDVVDKFFYTHSHIPRALPFYNVIHQITALLMQQGVEIAKGKQRLLPDLWTIVLAPSGAGKTHAQKAIAEAMGGPVKLFPDANSSVKFAQNLKDHRLGLFLKDEFAQFLKDVEKNSNMQEVHGYILQTYDNSDIEYATSKSKITIPRSAISILGYSALASFPEHLTREMLLSGFAQRFGFAVSEKDGRRRVPDFDFDELPSLIHPLWAKLSKTGFHPVYYVDPVAKAVYHDAYHIVMDRADAEGVDEGFSQRVMFRTYKYALAYHILTGKTDNVLHAEDMIYGSRLAAMNLRDLCAVLALYPKPKRAVPIVVSAAAVVATSPAASAPVAAVSAVAAPTGQHAHHLPRAKEIINKFAARGEMTGTSNLGAFLKLKRDVLAGILTELMADPAYSPHITPPKK